MITILTANRYRTYKRSLFYLIKYICIFFLRKYYLDLNSFKIEVCFSSHSQVARSLIEGLNQNKIQYNLNPKHDNHYYKTVIVLSGTEELQKAINLKSKNIIKYIFAGPNIAILPSDQPKLFSDNRIDYFITPTKWVTKAYYSDMKTLKGRIFEWYAGVNNQYWIESEKIKKKFVLIYIKNYNNFKIDITGYLKYLKTNRVKYFIIKYGYYNNINFLRKLNNSLCCVFFARSESQGIAMAEAWSTNTPTLIFDNNYLFYKGKRIDSNSSPYLTSETGLFFKDLHEFKIKFSFLIDNTDNFSPRNWVNKNMTDGICAKKLINEVISRTSYS